jgi:multidrug efflux system membrane fusion protein
MFLRVQLTIGQPAATVLVPELAIGVDQGRRYVAVVDHENRVMHRPVETGRSVANPTGMLRVITHGLDGSERLVVSGMARARDGSLVRPVPEADTPAEQPGAASL